MYAVTVVVRHPFISIRDRQNRPRKKRTLFIDRERRGARVLVSGGRKRNVQGPLSDPHPHIYRFLLPL